MQHIFQDPTSSKRAHVVQHWVEDGELDVAVVFQEAVALGENMMPRGLFKKAGEIAGGN